MQPIFVDNEFFGFLYADVDEEERDLRTEANPQASEHDVFQRWFVRNLAY